MTTLSCPILFQDFSMSCGLSLEFGILYSYTGPVGHFIVLSGLNESGANNNNESEKVFVKRKEYVWHQHKDYVGGATC